jgi:hypothetical protein
MARLNAGEYKTFESIRRVRDDGTEFWYARELAVFVTWLWHVFLGRLYGDAVCRVPRGKIGWLLTEANNWTNREVRHSARYST